VPFLGHDHDHDVHFQQHQTRNLVQLINRVVNQTDQTSYRMGDEENAEMNAQQKAKPDVQSGGSSKSSLIDTYAPVPDFFYDVKREIEPIGSSSTRVRHLATVLYMSTIFVLFGSLLYNYMPAQRISQESIVTSEWQKDGFVCKPLQKTTIDGLSTDWSFDECVAGVSSPNVDTVIPVEKSDNSYQFDYQFATQGDTSGSLSFWDTWNGNAVTSDDWQKDGFVCKPLQKTTIDGLSTDWSFDECVSSVSVADTSTVTAVRKHHDDHFDYAFFSDGVISFYDDAYDSSILQKTNAATDDWKRDGYACYPEPPYDNSFNVRYNYSECYDAIKEPSVHTIDGDLKCVTMGVEFTCFSYYPFGIEAEYYGYSHMSSFAFSDIYNGINHLNLSPNVLHLQSSGPDVFDYFTISGVSTYNMYTALYEYETIEQSSAIDSWKKIIATPDYGLVRYGNEGICAALKLNENGFRCLDKPTPPATKELAIERYASEYTAATICDPLKQNSPFQCTPTDTPPTTKELAIERYTAAYTPSAQAVFAVGGLVFVSFLRKLEKPGKNTATSVDDDLRVLVRKLRVGQEELRGDQSRHEELIQNLLKKAGDHQA
jgi:hypothetical protein